jgi:hypothetical protein
VKVPPVSIDTCQASEASLSRMGAVILERLSCEPVLCVQDPLGPGRIVPGYNDRSEEVTRGR